MSRYTATVAQSQFGDNASINQGTINQTIINQQRDHDETGKQCLHALYETDPRHDKTRIEETKGGLLRDSYSWVLETPRFTQWRNDSSGRLFWIRGDPGKGRTMLICGIIDELEKETPDHLSYFFCQATEQKLSNATAVLRVLIHSLILKAPHLLSHARKEFDAAGKQQFEGINAFQVMSKILTSILDDPALGPAILIVDALDECSTDRSQLLDFITHTSAKYSAKWAVSSRNWPDIEEKLDQAAQRVALRLELNEDSIADAVRVYIDYKVNEG